MWLRHAPFFRKQMTLVTLQTGSQAEKGPEHTSRLSISGHLTETGNLKERTGDQYLLAGEQSTMIKKNLRKGEGV